jgi:DNA gyrase subunit A
LHHQHHHGGFIKRTAVSAFRAQRRGGKGVIGMQTREGATEEEEGDFVEHLFAATTHDYLMFFTAEDALTWKKFTKFPRWDARQRAFYREHP